MIKITLVLPGQTEVQGFTRAREAVGVCRAQKGRSVRGRALTCMIGWRVVKILGEEHRGGRVSEPGTLITQAQVEAIRESSKNDAIAQRQNAQNDHEHQQDVCGKDSRGVKSIGQTKAKAKHGNRAQRGPPHISLGAGAAPARARAHPRSELPSCRRLAPSSWPRPWVSSRGTSS